LKAIKEIINTTFAICTLLAHCVMLLAH